MLDFLDSAFELLCHKPKLSSAGLLNKMQPPYRLVDDLRRRLVDVDG
jgi:hypothetical protein